MECKWQVEIDDYATRVLEKHWPDVRTAQRYMYFSRPSPLMTGESMLFAGAFRARTSATPERGPALMVNEAVYSTKLCEPFAYWDQVFVVLEKRGSIAYSRDCGGSRDAGLARV